MSTQTPRFSEASMFDEDASETAISGLRGGDRVSTAAKKYDPVVLNRKDIYDHIRTECRGPKTRLAKLK